MKASNRGRRNREVCCRRSSHLGNPLLDGVHPLIEVFLPRLDNMSDIRSVVWIKRLRRGRDFCREIVFHATRQLANGFKIYFSCFWRKVSHPWEHGTCVVLNRKRRTVRRSQPGHKNKLPGRPEVQLFQSPRLLAQWCATPAKGCAWIWRGSVTIVSG